MREGKGSNMARTGWKLQVVAAVLLVSALAVAGVQIPRAAWAAGYEFRFNPLFWNVGVVYARHTYGCLKITTFGPFAYHRRVDLMKALHCQHSLIDLNVAAESWALAHRKRNGDRVAVKTLLEEAHLQYLPSLCPAGGRYPDTIVVGEPPACTVGASGDSDPRNDHHLPD